MSVVTSVNKKALAYALNKDVRTIERMECKKENPLPVKKLGRGKPNEYDLAEVLAWYENEIRSEYQGTTDDDIPPGEGLDYVQQKARLAKEQADGQALKNSVTRRELVPVKLLELTLSDVGAQVGSVLESIPLKIKKRFPHLKNQEIEGIKRELVKAQNAASQPDIDFDSLSRVVNESSS